MAIKRGYFLSMKIKFKEKFPLHTRKVFWANGGTTPLILNLDTRWKCMARSQRTEQIECNGKTDQICESLLHNAVTLWLNIQAWTRPYPESVGTSFLRNVCIYLPYYTAPHHKCECSHSHLSYECVVTPNWTTIISSWSFVSRLMKFRVSETGFFHQFKILSFFF
jgi:hypothetical protein